MGLVNGKSFGALCKRRGNSVTGFLASVKSLDEAKTVLEFDVDIIDMKDPANGALGALETGEITKIVEHVSTEAWRMFCVIVFNSQNIEDLNCISDEI